MEFFAECVMKLTLNYSVAIDSFVLVVEGITVR